MAMRGSGTVIVSGETIVDEIANAVAILLDEIETHHAEITDREIARRVAIVRVQLEELQLQLDPTTQLTL